MSWHIALYIRFEVKIYEANIKKNTKSHFFHLLSLTTNNEEFSYN